MKQFIVRILFLSIISCLTIQTYGQKSTTAEPLKDLAVKTHLKYIGISTNFLTNNGKISNQADLKKEKDLIAQEFNVVTTENCLKAKHVQPERGVFDFALPDTIITFLESNNITPKGHFLIGNNQYSAEWLAKGKFTNEELNLLLDIHIETVMGRYRGRIKFWDVVNEALIDDGSGNFKLDSNCVWNQLGKNALGVPLYIEKAFIKARKVDPSCKLIYNECYAEELGAKSDVVYNMIKDFQRRGIPIDAIGFQGHIPEKGVDYKSVVKNFQRFADLGLDIIVSEFDVRTPDYPTEQELKKVADVYKNFVQVCVDQPKCIMFQTWNISNKYTWINNWYKKDGHEAPLWFDAGYLPNQAYYAVHKVLKNEASK